jgi:hypothetical protein
LAAWEIDDGAARQIAFVIAHPAGRIIENVE